MPKESQCFVTVGDKTHYGGRELAESLRRSRCRFDRTGSVTAKRREMLTAEWQKRKRKSVCPLQNHCRM